MGPRRLMPIPASPPRAGSRKHCKDPEEHPGQLQPQLPRSLHHRPPHRLAKTLAPALQPLSRLHHLRRRPRRLLAQPRSGRRTRLRLRSAVRSRRTCSTARNTLRRRIRSRRRIHRRHQRLRRRTSPNSKRTTESNRIHVPSVAAPAPRQKDASSNQQRLNFPPHPSPKPSRFTPITPIGTRA
jgi:hypothetical protein